VEYSDAARTTSLRFYLSTEWFGLEGTFKAHLDQPPCHGQGHLLQYQVAQSPVQSDFERSQHIHPQLLWMTCSSVSPLSSQKVSYGQSKPTPFQLKAAAPCPVMAGPGKKQPLHLSYKPPLYTISLQEDLRRAFSSPGCTAPTLSLSPQQRCSSPLTTFMAFSGLIPTGPCLALRTPELDAVLHVGSHKSRVEVESHLLQDDSFTSRRPCFPHWWFCHCRLKPSVVSALCRSR